jgi:ubiquinone/menaquinone biosynthesis C-methylase UbiE
VASERWERAYQSVERDVEERKARIRSFGLEPCRRVLDLGCGDGIDLEAFRALGFSALTGLDLIPTLVRRAVGRSFRVINGDVAALGAKDASFDVVYGNNILHHLPDQDRAFAEVRRVLRVGGLFCFVEPAATGFRRWVDRVTMSTLARVVPVLEHRRIILEEEMADYRRWLSTQDQLPGRLARHGFRCVETRKGMFRLYAKWQAA